MLGKVRMVENIDAKFGAAPWYFFVKIQTADTGLEEYWLVTENEEEMYLSRALANPEDAPAARRGLLVQAENTLPRFGANRMYYALRVSPHNRPQEQVTWMLTEGDLKRIRERVSANAEDIEANRESWLADLLD